MKTKLLFFLLIAGSALFAQTEVSVDKDYIPYQDSLFILQTVTITNQGIEGVNDTIIEYTPPAIDTAGLLHLLYTQSLNKVNEKTSLLRRAIAYRKINADEAAFDALIDELGGNTDSFRLATYATALKGKWRYIDNLGTSRTFDLIDHPNLSTRLRMDEDGGANDNMNVKISGRWRITVRIGLENLTFVWSGEDRDRPVFYLEKFLLPNSALDGDVDNSRWVKVN